MNEVRSVLLVIIILNACNPAKMNDKPMNSYNDKQDIIENFIHAYNTFDIDGMLKDLHEDIKFENISNGQVDLTTNGIEEFKNQAEDAKEFFKERQMNIIDIKFSEDTAEVFIDYFGILAKDLPEGLKSGDTLKLQGRSVYIFKNNKIISIQDIS